MSTLHSTSSLDGWGQLFSGPAPAAWSSLPVARSSAAACYARYSSDLQSTDSLDQQQRACRTAAERHGLTISDQLLFTDEAVSGTKLQRTGLHRMVQAAEQGQFSTLYLYSLSRLARETSIAVPLVKTLVHRHGIRIVSVAEAIDTSQPGWELALQVLSLMHEQYIRDLAANVRRGHEAAQRRGHSTGDYPFGYRSTPAPGYTPPVGSRSLKVPKVCVIDKSAAAWVRQIFQMYVEQRFSQLKIAKELNRLRAPKDHRSSTATWHAGTVRSILANPKYTGRWSWGRTKTRRDPMTGQTCQEVQDVSEQQRWQTERPQLRIISDELFMAAQDRLAAEARVHTRRTNGQLRGGATVAGGQPPRQLLSCLVTCGHCQSPFYVTGRDGKYLGCAKQLTGDCPCNTKLPRARAERLILAAIGDLLQNNPAWVEDIHRATLTAWQTMRDAQVPRRQELERQLQGLSQKIKHLVDLAEGGVAPADLRTRLAQRRSEQAAVESELRQLSESAAWLQQAPTREWVVSQLTQLHELLRSATPVAASALRRLVGGRIVVEQIKVPGKQRGFLRGRFTLAARACLTPGSAAPVFPTDHHSGQEIVIDFREPDPNPALAEQVWALFQAGKLQIEIAQHLKLGRNRVSRLLKQAAHQQGVPLLDGRSRRKLTAHKQRQPPRHEQLAAEVMTLYQSGLLLSEIAHRLGTHLNMITAAIRFWHQSRGLPVPDGRTRRKLLAKPTPQ